jgi:hypothetical protein
VAFRTYEAVGLRIEIVQHQGRVRAYVLTRDALEQAYRRQAYAEIPEPDCRDPWRWVEDEWISGLLSHRA